MKNINAKTMDNIYAPFEKGGAYCVAHVGRSVGRSVGRYVGLP